MEKDVSQTNEEEKTQPEAEKKVETKEETTTVIEAAKEVNRVKAELLNREEKLIERREKLAAEDMLGGKSEAGQGTPKKPEEDAIEYAKKIASGEVNPLDVE